MTDQPPRRPPPRWQSFLAELRRRRVFRVAAVYGATAFAVLQGADITFPRLGLPDWTVTFLLVLTLAAFPIALVLAWAYERGPEGLRRTDPAAPGEIEAIVAEPRSRRWPAGIAAVVGIALLALAGAWGFGALGHRHRAYGYGFRQFNILTAEPGMEGLSREPRFVRLSEQARVDIERMWREVEESPEL